MDNNGYRLLLPEGTLDYFIISDVKERGQCKNLRGNICKNPIFA
jgi:hypothetical protein